MALPSFRYSGVSYAGQPAGTTAFALTTSGGQSIGYLLSSHIHVYASADSGTTLAELTRPAQWDFNQAKTGVVLTTGIADGVAIVLQRVTPQEGAYTEFGQGTLLTAQQLNDAVTFSLYVSQETEDQTAAGVLDAAMALAKSTTALAQSTTSLTQSTEALARSSDAMIASGSALSAATDAVSTSEGAAALSVSAYQKSEVAIVDSAASVVTATEALRVASNAIGTEGPVGPQGPTGLTGPTGPQGVQGPQGIKGDTGARGLDGATGPTGAQGSAGLGLNLKGTVATAANLPGGAAVNDGYITDDTGNVHIWDGSKWIDAGRLQGPQGPQGVVGPSGSDGDQGIQGEKGDPGPEGPQGVQGIQGTTGPTGPQGPAGNPASISITGTAPVQVTGTAGAPVIGLDQSNLALLNGTQSFSGLQTFNGGIDASSRYSGNITAVAALNIDCSLGNYFTKTIAGDGTFTFTGAPATRSYAFTLKVAHTSGVITWPASVKWPGGKAPSPTAGKTHLFMFHTDDSGTSWRASSLLNYTT